MAEFHADLGREREVTRRGQAREAARVRGVLQVGPGRVDEQVGVGRGGQAQHAVLYPAAGRRVGT